MKRRPRFDSYNNRDDRRDYDYNRDDEFEYAPEPEPQSRGKKAASWLSATAIAILAGVFILGIGVGIGFSATTATNDTALVTNLQVDQKAPNPDVCIQNGASAISLNTRLYVTLTPFKVYVAQGSMEPACVIRRANWAVLEQRKLLTAEQSRECRQRMNTFAYVGNLDNKPTIDCIYQSDNAKNLFLSGGSAQTPSLGGDDQF
jgi:hypothetical protein